MNDPLGAPGAGLLSVSIDGGAWEDIAGYVVAGLALFEGVQWLAYRHAGFRQRLAGHRVQFRWEAVASPSFTADPAYWAISRVQIDSAAEPMFSRVVADTS